MIYLGVGIDCLLLSLLSRRFFRAQGLLKISYISQLTNIIHKHIHEIFIHVHFQNQKIKYQIYLGAAVASLRTGSHFPL